MKRSEWVDVTYIGKPTEITVIDFIFENILDGSYDDFLTEVKRQCPGEDIELTAHGARVVIRKELNAVPTRGSKTRNVKK